MHLYDSRSTGEYEGRRERVELVKGTYTTFFTSIRTRNVDRTIVMARHFTHLCTLPRTLAERQGEEEGEEERGLGGGEREAMGSWRGRAGGVRVGIP